MLHLVQAFREFRELLRVVRESFRPLRTPFAAALPDGFTELFAHAIRDQELRILRPPVKFLDQPHFLFAKRLAVRSIRILLVR